MARLSIKVYWIILLMLHMSASMSGEYDPLLLRAQASIFPKIMLLDKEIKQKMVNNEYRIKIVTNKNETEGAEQLKLLIEEKYKSKLAGMALNVQVITGDELQNIELGTAYIVMQVDHDTYQNVISYASKKNRIVFGYNYTDFQYDTLISLLLKEKTYIYLNKPAIQMYDVKFTPVFYKIVKLVE